MAATMNEMSAIILDWIREMDSEPGGTLREAAEHAGKADDPEAVAPQMKLAFMAINAPFLASAPPFIRAAFAHCFEQVDWAEVVRTRFAEMDEE